MCGEWSGAGAGVHLPGASHEFEPCQTSLTLSAYIVPSAFRQRIDGADQFTTAEKTMPLARRYPKVGGVIRAKVADAEIAKRQTKVTQNTVFVVVMQALSKVLQLFRPMPAVHARRDLPPFERGVAEWALRGLHGDKVWTRSWMLANHIGGLATTIDPVPLVFNHEAKVTALLGETSHRVLRLWQDETPHNKRGISAPWRAIRQLAGYQQSECLAHTLAPAMQGNRDASKHSTPSP